MTDPQPDPERLNPQFLAPPPAAPIDVAQPDQVTVSGAVYRQPMPGWAIGVLSVVLTGVIAYGFGAASTLTFTIITGGISLFFGVPYGLFALILSTVWTRRLRAAGKAEKNRYAHFETLPQVYSLWVNLATILLGLVATVQVACGIGDVLVPAFIWGSFAGVCLIAASIPTLLNRRALAGELYAEQQLPRQAKYVRLARFARWSAYAMVAVVALATYLQGSLF